MTQRCASSAFLAVFLGALGASAVAFIFHWNLKNSRIAGQSGPTMGKRYLDVRKTAKFGIASE
jgi:hypothetical protein